MTTIIIEGVFDGQHMIDKNGKIHPVPPNYASKSKLLEGDQLKLTITEDGSFVYKQINRVESKKVRAVLVYDETNKRYEAEYDGRFYKILYASISFFKAQVGDEVAILIPKNYQSSWAALENVIKVYKEPTEVEL